MRTLMARVAAALVCTAAAALPLRLAAQAPPPRLRGELGFSLGAALSHSGAESLHRQSFSAGPLAGASLENAFSISPKASVFIGGSFSRFFGSTLGILAGFGYAKNGLAAETVHKAGGPFPAITRTLALSPNPSEITAVPIYAGLAARWTGRRSTLVFSAGPALYLHSILVETEAGLPAVPSGGGAAAVFLTHASVPDLTWIALGFQAGLAANLPISASTALCFEARYFHSPGKSFAWTWAPGTLPGLDDAARMADFDAAAAQAAAAATQPLVVNPSLIQISAGLRFRLR
jgi:hypothetical protein